jgi:hypothetical protein
LTIDRYRAHRASQAAIDTQAGPCSGRPRRAAAASPVPTQATSWRNRSE